MHFFVLRLEADSSTRTYVCASSALSTNVRINRIVLALRDSTHRTLIDTRTASDTIGRNFVSHKAIYDLVIYHLFIYCVIAPFFIWRCKGTTKNRDYQIMGIEKFIFCVFWQLRGRPSVGHSAPLTLCLSVLYA